MNIFFLIIIFIIGITFGSFYTLAVYRIPKGEDIIHKHSYCPKCNHKLNFIDLIPVLSYIFLRGKCRYCNKKIRPRYFIIETMTGVLFVLIAYLINLNINNLELIKVIDYSFIILYLTFIILISGINKENKQINKPVLMYGIIISIIYIVYLYIIEKTSIYRYVIYLVIFAVLLLLDTIRLKKHAKNNSTYSILMLILIMSIFTGEYVLINTIISTLLAISIYLSINKIKNSKNKKTIKQYSEEIPFALYLSIANIVYFIVVLTYIRI